MANASFSDTLSGAQLITAGSQAHLSELSSRGMTQEFVTSMETRIRGLHTKNAEQEALKSRLKEKPSSIESDLEELRAQVSEAKKVIKLVIPKEGWKEFGLT